ncbi:uncharacterized protein LODBEIA_P05380 [Lodderomyces beijingensis]|uniref:Pre-mRNA-splicing factor CWC21 n=1 Tax=Lodderomyces beijingensis TaxID=1775926 RepID=A0ABP0ZDQ3_9ASCO
MSSGGVPNTGRGSGSSGYVQKNISAESKPKGRYESRELNTRKDKWREDQETQDRLRRETDEVLATHNKLRGIEVSCAELEDELERRGFSEQEIDDKVNKLRTRLKRQMSEQENKANADVDDADSKSDVYSYTPRFS